MVRFAYDDFSLGFQSLLSNLGYISDSTYLVEFNCTAHALWWEDTDEHHIDDETLENFEWDA